MSIGFQVTFTEEFLYDTIRMFMNKRDKKISYISFEPSERGDLELIIKYKEKYEISLDAAYGGTSEWAEKRMSFPLHQVTIEDKQ